VSLQGHHPGRTEQGNAWGRCNYTGEGVWADQSEGTRYPKLSADQGNPLGRSNDAWAFEQVAGVSRTIVDAGQCFNVAADEGDPGAENGYVCAIQSGTLFHVYNNYAVPEEWRWGAKESS
jgi:TPR repeat protein